MEKKRISKVFNLETAVPPNEYNQQHLADWMANRLNPENERLHRILKALYRKTKIETRHSVLPDFNSKEANPLLFKENKQEPSVQERLAIYNKEALLLAKESSEKSLLNFNRKTVTHLITVSCTGMSAPGLEIQLKQELKLANTVECHAINFIGCYAVFPAFKLANAICGTNPEANVLIVAVELCTLHFQNKDSEDHLLSNSLFSDGAASIIMNSSDTEKSGSLSYINYNQLLIPKGKNDMAWNIHSDGFLMKLSSYIPELLNEGISDLVGQIIKKCEIDKSEINHWAIHPGGRKILEVCEKELNLEKGKLLNSFEVLRKFGNMSAPTILFVLKEMLTQSNLKKGEKLFTCGFGPGLTLEAALFQIN